MKNQRKTTSLTAGAATAPLLLALLALAGCADAGDAADLDVDATQTDSQEPMQALGWSWTDDALQVRAQMHRYVPIDAAGAADLTGTVTVTSGPPIDFLVLTADDFAAFERHATYTAAEGCSAAAQTQLTLSGCTLAAGAYVIVLHNASPHSPDEQPTPQAGPATAAVALQLTPQAT